MRLGQLARQLDIKPEKIITFLQKEKEITIKEHPNSKVEDELVTIITDHFAPEPIVEEAAVVEEAIEEEKVEELVVEHVEPEHIETAKPEAVQELKIIGKIDLPNRADINVEVDGVVYDQETLDKKKKEEQKEIREQKAVDKEAKRKEEEEKRTKAREQRAIEQERKAMLETEKHNILTKAEEKKKEIAAKEQQEREEKLEERRKEKQKDHYQQQMSETVVKKTPPKKKKKVVVQATIEKPSDVKSTPQPVTPKVESPKETSVLKRFIKWLNT